MRSELRSEISPRLVLALVVGGVAGCRPDPGVPDYGRDATILARATETAAPEAGPSPWQPGQKRLSLELFYEGGATETLGLGERRQYYIFAIEGSNQLTYTQESVSDRVEGLAADQLTLAGTGWWGGGLVWSDPTDLSGWTTLHVSLRGDAPALADLQLRMLWGEGEPAAASVTAAEHGWVADGAWHHLALPLAAFEAAGADLTRCRGPFVIGGGAVPAGSWLLVDNLYVD